MQTNEQPEGDVVVTTTEEGYIVCVTRQDEEGRILSIIAEGKSPREKEDIELIRELEDVLDFTISYGASSWDRWLHEKVNAALKLARKRLEGV